MNSDTSNADSALRRFGNFAKWLFAGCRVICDHNRGVAYVIPLAGAAEWRHKDDGTVCDPEYAGRSTHDED